MADRIAANVVVRVLLFWVLIFFHLSAPRRLASYGAEPLELVVDLSTYPFWPWDTEVAPSPSPRAEHDRLGPSPSPQAGDD